MSDLVRVSQEGTPDTFSIDTGDPKITIVKASDPVETIIISPDPSKVIVTDDHPEIVVSYNFAKSIGVEALLVMLDGALDATHFVTGVETDLEFLHALNVLAGYDPDNILLESDKAGILSTAATYTDVAVSGNATNISLLSDDLDDEIAARILGDSLNVDSIAILTTSTDDGFTSQLAYINLTADNIAFSISSLESDVAGNLSEAVALIDITTNAILLSVSTLETDTADDLADEIAARILGDS